MTCKFGLARLSILFVLATLAACGGGGAGGGSTAAPPPNNVARFAYVTNLGSNNISAYTINATTGALSEVAGSPFAAGQAPQPLTVDPSGKFVYAANSGADSVSAYAIDAASGALSEVVGSPFAAGNFPFSVTFDPSGKFAYVPNSISGSVSAYAINATTGALSEVAGSPFVAGISPYSLTVHPTGKFVYVANTDSNNISAYTIAATGALTSIGAAVAAGDKPHSVTIDPSGKFAYVANGSSYQFGCVSPSVSAYTINASTGALSEVAGSPFATPSRPGSVTVDPSGRFAYVANIGCPFSPSSQISAYTINASTGALSQVAGSPFTAGNAPWVVSIDRSGKFAYVANTESNNISAYIINAASGALSEVAGSPFAAGAFAAGGGASVTFDPSGRFAYVANDNSNDVSAYTINPSSGALSKVAGSPFAAGRIPVSVTTTHMTP